MKLAIITACPAGIATSFMAAKRLEEEAKKQGIEAITECHSSVTSVTLLTTEQLQSCDKIILALPESSTVDRSRLQGLSVVDTTIEAILADPAAVIGLSGTAYTAPVVTAVATSQSINVVAVTACPTGVAHTFMAAEALEQGAQKRGWNIKVETRGSVGAKNQLTADEIAAADFVILATDIEVDRSPFNGKRVYHCGTGVALKKTQQVLDDAQTQATVQSGSAQSTSSSEDGAKKEKSGPYKHLLTGVSFMLPVVVAGGLLIALSFLFGGIHAGDHKGTFAWALSQIGGATAFALMIPVLAGYIAYSIADRPGIAPGMIGGMLASTLNAGFIGGIIAGFIAGYAAKLLTRYIKLPTSVESLKPILLIPLLASAITGLAMIYVIGTPTAAIMAAMTSFLKHMGSANAILMGLILGLMMCFDLGGPINKASYTFGVGLLASQTGGDASATMPMAAIMAAGMVPPLGMGIATFIARRKFTKPEAEGGKAAFVLGLCFISEGAIPFAARDPMRVIPINMIGGAITGALSMYLHCELRAPHGGIFVLLIPHAINNVLAYLAAIVIGALVTGVLYAFVRKADMGETSESAQTA
ncbi:PTS fructose-like transporter subunit IIB [Celerinatantimonas sp. YJH-8]|uniref:PTS fructose-like transporter subunit IIB n=1 Tax=Celerinatantimonas sp. YJH-8 TaxID=3228714 RepID=UPI0038C45B57